MSIETIIIIIIIIIVIIIINIDKKNCERSFTITLVFKGQKDKYE